MPLSIEREQKRKKHLYIERKKGACGGEPVIVGTRISVSLIVELERMGYTVDEIIAMYPHLTHSQVYDALSYYYDHKEEVDQYIRENSEDFIRTKYKRAAWLK